MGLLCRGKPLLVVAALGRCLWSAAAALRDLGLKGRGRKVRAGREKLAQVPGIGRGVCSKGNLKGVAGREEGLE